MKTAYPFSRDLVAAVLDRYYSGVAMRGDEVHGESLPTQEEFAAKVAEYLEGQRIAGIKAKAGELIAARYPAWKQNNLTAQAVEAILNYLLTLPGTDEAKAQLTNSILGIGAWAWVKQVRSESDRLEADPNATANWPA